MCRKLLFGNPEKKRKKKSFLQNSNVMECRDVVEAANSVYFM